MLNHMGGGSARVDPGWRRCGLICYRYRGRYVERYSRFILTSSGAHTASRPNPVVCPCPSSNLPMSHPLLVRGSLAWSLHGTPLSTPQFSATVLQCSTALRATIANEGRRTPHVRATGRRVCVLRQGST